METENSSSGFYLDQLESSQINTKFDKAIANLTTIVNYLSSIKIAINSTTLEDKIEIVNELDTRIASIEAIKKQISDKKASINTKINNCQNFYNNLVQKCEEYGTKTSAYMRFLTTYKEKASFSVYKINETGDITILKNSTRTLLSEAILSPTTTTTKTIYKFRDTQPIPKVENIANFLILYQRKINLTVESASFNKLIKYCKYLTRFVYFKIIMKRGKL